LQRREAILGRQGYELHLFGIVEHGSRDRPAKIDIESGPFPLCVRKPEASKRAVAAAIEHSTILHRFERLS
jgi:hypothetical protein